MSASRPIFVGGLMRSGTTLLRAMLGQHSRIAAGLETHWFELDWQAGTARRGEPLREYLHRLAALYGIDAEAVDRMMAAASDAPSFLDAFLGAYARALGKPRWAEKTPGNVLHLDRIVAHWPDARIVHIVRDPKDVFASFRRSAKYGGPADYGALWADYFGAVARFRAALPLGPERLLECRYEALVSAPERETRRLLAFLGEAWEPAVARFEGKQDEYERVLALTGHASRTLDELRRPLSAGRIGRWQEVIDEAEVETARRVVRARGLGALFAKIEAEGAGP